MSRLINDGDALEVGLGSLPDAALECLFGKRDLGIRTGAIGDRVAELAEVGVITNAGKPIDMGKSVTATSQRDLHLEKHPVFCGERNI